MQVGKLRFGLTAYLRLIRVKSVLGSKLVKVATVSAICIIFDGVALIHNVAESQFETHVFDCKLST